MVQGHIARNSGREIRQLLLFPVKLRKASYSTPGVDRVHLGVLKELGEVIAEPLSIIFENLRRAN